MDIDFASIKLPEIFEFLQKTGNVSNEEMFRTFNCGIGMVLVCDPENADQVIDLLRDENPKIIGKLK